MFNYCPCCGGTLIEKELEGKKRLVCSICDFVFYQNPKPCVGVLLEKDGKLMLTRRGIEPFYGWWDLPGGFLEVGEHPEEGARREIEEETGLKVEITQLLSIEMDVYGENNCSTLNLHYRAKLVGGEEKPDSDITEIRWFSADELPEKIAFENCRKAVNRWKESLQDERTFS